MGEGDMGLIASRSFARLSPYPSSPLPVTGLHVLQRQQRRAHTARHIRRYEPSPLVRSLVGAAGSTHARIMLNATGLLGEAANDHALPIDTSSVAWLDMHRAASMTPHSPLRKLRSPSVVLGTGTPSASAALAGPPGRPASSNVSFAPGTAARRPSTSAGPASGPASAAAAVPALNLSGVFMRSPLHGPLGESILLLQTPGRGAKLLAELAERTDALRLSAASERSHRGAAFPPMRGEVRRKV